MPLSPTERNAGKGLNKISPTEFQLVPLNMVSACVGVSGLSQGSADVLATHDMFIGRTSVIKGSREKLEGTFSLSSTMPDRVIFYLEGPAPGVDLLITKNYKTR